MRVVAGVLAAVLFLTLGTPLAAEAQDHQRPAPAESFEGDEGAYEGAYEDAYAPGTEGALPFDPSDDGDGPGIPDLLGEAGEGPALPGDTLPVDPLEDPTPATLPDADDIAGASPESLPVGEAKTAVTPQRISLPNAEGSVEGMGESFAPVLSSGTATFSVPIAVAAGRNGVQPSVGLSYSSTGGNAAVGIGWNLSTPFIVRQSDRGLPRYVDDARWTEEEDRFFYNGGQELIPVDSAAMATVDASGLYTGADQVPTELTDWPQYRARVEGGFMRFFRSPDFMRWVVQGKDGTRFDFGLLPATAPGPADFDATVSLQSEEDGGAGRIYAWHLTRMSDPHGSTVYYQYLADRGERYIDHITYLSPHSCGVVGDPAATRGCTEPLRNYGARVAFTYENRPDVFRRYTSGWRIEQALRLRRVTVTAAGDTVGTRYLVRRYHLTYLPAAESFHSLLASVTVEGRPDTAQGAGDYAHDVFDSAIPREDDLGEGLVGRTLPSMTFDYTRTPAGPVLGFGGLDNTVYAVSASPNVSVDAARADLFDVNTDGLPDLVVTDPARYRTSDGAPAVGVFFNGFTGESAAPAGAAGVFSAPIAVPMPGGLSGTLNFGNRNIVPMDVDGDGRSDLLHMPRLDRYGFFTPIRAAGDSVSPARQGWRFAYQEVDLTPGEDPRVDFVRDPTHYKVFDVNGDHLIDVVRTTGTAMQTWLNLGWLPGGEGRFGQARYDGSGWTLSTTPHETCLLHDGLPVDFADPEVRLADMNGDGLQDIVKVRRGRVVYWPGRGTTSSGAPVFGEGPAVCPRGDGDGREVVMATPPAELNVELSNVFVSDVNADGAADVLQVRFDAVDVWFNRAGEGFTERAIVRAPMAPDFAPRIRFADIDGSATTDLVYAQAGNWQYMDLLGGLRPRLLTTVENGLGATTTIAYGSSAADYTQDLVEAEATSAHPLDRFTWSATDPACDAVLADGGDCLQRSGGSPVVSTVVRSVETNDHFALVGRTDNVVRTEFAYHNGYYEGIEQEFRGFGAADAVALGDVHHPTSTTRTHFHQGRRPSDIASNRLADNPREALKGRQWLSETFNEAGVYLNTRHATVMTRKLATGRDGTGIYYAYVSQSDELRYGTATGTGTETYGWVPGSETLTLPKWDYAEVGASGAIPTTSTPEDHTIPVRGSHWAHLRTTSSSVDNLGHVRSARNHGRLRDPEVQSPSGSFPYEYADTFLTPTLLVPESWIWRTQREMRRGLLDDNKPPFTDFTYDPVTGDMRFSRLHNRLYRNTHDPVAIPPPDFTGDAAGAQDFTVYSVYANGGHKVMVDNSTFFDVWGNPTRQCGGRDLYGTAATNCFRYGVVEYDSAYAQLPTREAIAVHRSLGESYCSSLATPYGFCALETSATWDRGLGVLLDATDPNGQTSRVRYDGLGRLTGTLPPAHPGDTCTDTPSTVIHYELNSGGTPISVVDTVLAYACGSPSATRTRAYVDGLGRARASATRGDVNTGGGTKQWVQDGVGTFSARGTPVRAFEPAALVGDPPTAEVAVRLPSTVYTEVRHDAFGRAVQTIERDTSPSEVRHGALSTRAHDALDLGGDPTFSGTPTTVWTDGFGRAIKQLLINQMPGGTQTEYHRLDTTYRYDGTPSQVTRLQATSADPDAPVLNGRSVTRTFLFDAAGNRVSATDPDSDDPSQPAHTGRWRYLFNKVGDLVAVRDPRGCGQNFYYDYAGRLLGEDYVQCGEAQVVEHTTNLLLPNHSIGAAGPVSGQSVDVLYHYDALPYGEWLSAASPSPAAPVQAYALGRLTGTTDRGQRSAVAYDARGRVAWTGRQMAMLPAIPNLRNGGAGGASLSGNQPTVLRDDESTVPVVRAYDDETYVTVPRCC